MSSALLIMAGWKGSAQTNIQTGLPSDLAIVGPGYFIVRDPDSGRSYVTRYGAFFQDSNGYLVAANGMRLQGYPQPANTTIGDIQLIASGESDSDFPGIADYFIDPDGSVILGLGDGTFFTCGQIVLQPVSQPQHLDLAGNCVYAWEAAAGPLPEPQPPGANDLGSLQSGFLEVPRPTVEISRVTGPPSLVAPGFLDETGVPTDMGIQGSGYFVLRDPNSQALFASRAGAFEFDPNGYLVNYAGLRVQGYADGTLSTIGDIQIPVVSAMLDGVLALRSGKVCFHTPDGSRHLAGEILLSNCRQPAELVATEFSLFPINSGDPRWMPMTIPESGGLGWIGPGTVEASQFDNAILAVRRTLKWFRQGSICSTGEAGDLAINGGGFFTVRNPADNSFYATRHGHFQLDATGHLETTNGWRVQGWTDPALSVPGDMVIDAAQKPAGADPAATVLAFVFENSGNVEVLLSDGTVYTRGQVTLQDFRNAQGLQTSDGIFFTDLAGALPMHTNAAPGDGELGYLTWAALEIIPPVKLPELTLLPHAGYRIQANTLGDGTNLIESSGDLVHWTVRRRVCANDIGAAEFFDTNYRAAATQFYRVSGGYF